MHSYLISVFLFRLSRSFISKIPNLYLFKNIWLVCDDLTFIVISVIFMTQLLHNFMRIKRVEFMTCPCTCFTIQSSLINIHSVFLDASAYLITVLVTHSLHHSLTNSLQNSIAHFLTHLLPHSLKNSLTHSF